MVCGILVLLFFSLLLRHVKNHGQNMLEFLNFEHVNNVYLCYK